MVKVTIVGTGNVSHHLERAFAETQDIQVIEVLKGRSLTSDTLFGTNRSTFEEPDVYLLAVSDDAIKSVAAHFKATKKLVAHTSGSVPIDVLSSIEQSGVFYPLQTFSKEQEVDFTSVPIGVEAHNENDLNLLKKMAETISDTVFEIDSEQRKTLHLAAVFVNNFTNHLYHIGHELCRRQEIPFDLLKPLIRETAHKIENLSPEAAQTGPAKRKDMKTIERHLDELQSHTQKEIYTILTKSIQEVHGEKL